MPYIYVEEAEHECSDKPSVILVGTDGNIFSLLGECKKAMESFERDVDPSYNAAEVYDEMFDEVQQGDYHNALRVIMGYMDVH